ncbi:MAG TPA: putative quinol monooxygenase [Bacteroidales bacterium]|jgi:quinol monooxygenase YgiN|nr:putative quinol monooxygenase [Bacteroidales bacterium]
MKKGFILMACITALMLSCDKQKTVTVPETDSTAAVNECQQRVIHASIFLKQERVEDFIKAARTMVDSSNMEPGCISYQLFQDPYDETKFMFVEVWKDQAAIDAHFKMPYFTAWGPKTADWYAQPTLLKIFDAAPQQ